MYDAYRKIASSWYENSWTFHFYLDNPCWNLLATTDLRSIRSIQYAGSRLMSRSINRRFASLLHISRYSLHRSTIWDCCVHLIYKRQKGYCKLRHIFWSLCCTSSEVSNANDNHWSGEANSNSFNMTATKSRSSLSHIHFLVPDKRSINNIKHQYR
jgi:hypothetical protein